MSLTKCEAKMLVVLGLGVIAGVVGMVFRTEAADKTDKLPEQARAILENADKIEIFAIHSREEGTFHSYKVLGSTIINKEERQKLVASILDGIDKFNGVPIYIWHPRFGIRAWHKEKTVDLIFCFHASQVLVYRNPNATFVQCDAGVLTNRKAEKLLENLLKQAKVPTSPKDE